MKISPHTDRARTGTEINLGPYDLYMLILSVFSLAVLAADTLLPLKPGARDVFALTDNVLCALFLFDFARSLARAPNRSRYLLRSGWLDLLSSIPAIGAFRLGRISRIARILRLLRAVRSVRTIGVIVSHHRQQSALLAASLMTILLVVFASLAILQFEQTPDANIKSGSDAIWWAFSTITTVGYGDRFPVTIEGRIVAAILMAAGVALFGTLSGLVASWFLHGEQSPGNRDRQQLDLLSAEMAALRVLIEDLHRNKSPTEPPRD